MAQFQFDKTNCAEPQDNQSCYMYIVKCVYRPFTIWMIRNYAPPTYATQTKMAHTRARGHEQLGILTHIMSLNTIMYTMWLMRTSIPIGDWLSKPL